MEKYITDERTGLRYELVGDYYLITGDDEPEEEQKPIGIWGAATSSLSQGASPCAICQPADQRKNECLSRRY